MDEKLVTSSRRLYVFSIGGYITSMKVAVDSLFKGSSSLQRGYIDALLCSLFTELYKLLSILEVLLASNTSIVSSH